MNPSASNPYLLPSIDGGWPVSAAEEQAFVDDLIDQSGVDVTASLRAGEEPPPELSSCSTAMLLALRSGQTLDDLLAVALGLTAAQLARAYRHLEARRRRSEAAWIALTCSASTQAFEQHRRSAAVLLPALIPQMSAAILQSGGLQGAIQQAANEVARAGQHALDVEHHARAAARGGHISAVAAADRLFNAACTGAWDAIAFLPPRIGTLNSHRLGRLLEHGEPAPSLP